MGAMFAFSNLAVPPPRAMSHMDVSQGDHQGSSGGAAGLKAGGADQRPAFHRSDMFLERSPTLATVGSSGSGVSSRAGTMGGGSGGNVRKQRLGQARSELRIIENHQHDNYATVSGASMGDSSARADSAAIAGTTLVQLQDLGRSTSQRSSQRPSLQSMFSAHGSLLQLEPSNVTTSNSAVDSGSSGGGGGGSSMHNLKQTLGGSFDDPSPYNTLKKRKVSQPSPLPPPPSKLAFNATKVQNSPASTDSPTGESRVSGSTGGLVENSHTSPSVSASLATSTPAAVSEAARTAAAASSYDTAPNSSPAVALRSKLATIGVHHNGKSAYS
jgi:hypothetical protein